MSLINSKNVLVLGLVLVLTLVKKMLNIKGK